MLFLFPCLYQWFVLSFAVGLFGCLLSISNFLKPPEAMQAPRARAHCQPLNLLPALGFGASPLCCEPPGLQAEPSSSTTRKQLQ